ncbi:MAG: xylose isomerase [Planctomycetes bacterium SM23_32]|nr:MAG: xylose isomerase [Planctomycetes bacterium SM23_32]
MARIPIGLELYSVRHELASDVRGTLRAVAEMGYDGVEFAGPPQHKADELRALLDEFGLDCCGWHTPFDLVQDERLDETIAFNETLGNRYVIVPGVPESLRSSREDWLKLAGFFNDLADKLAPHDMLTGYHNHHVEFTPMDGEPPWDTFFGNTGPGVIMQLDLGNALYGGADIVSLLEGYPGRAITVHLKPYSKEAGREDPRKGFRPLIGEDDVPWDGVFRLCETVGGTEWYIVEYESDAFPPLEAVDRCLQNLKAMGK